MIARPITERFEEKVDRSTGLGPHGSCHLWTAARNLRGYGVICEGGRRGKQLYAHRVAWELENGPISDGLHCCHHCDNPGCVNVEHIYLGTDADNMADRDAKGRQAKGSAHGNAKLTEADVRGIKRLLGQGVPGLELGRRYGVGSQLISKINTGKLWAHAGGAN
jgi:hypothetical protein